MARPRQAEECILRLVGECEVVRRQSLHLLPYHRVTINDTIRQILSAGYLREKEKGFDKHYILTPKGKEFLADIAWEYIDHDYLPPNIRSANWKRLLLSSDAIIMFQFCGIATHPAARPDYNDLSPQSANIFYPAIHLKHYLSNGETLPGLKYSRITGLLLTPDAPYRVYHTRNVAIEIRKQGENNIRDLIQANIESRIGQKGNGKVLVLGDKDMQSAEKMLYNTLYPNSTANRLRAAKNKKRKPHEVSNLLDTRMFGPDLYYLPLNRDAIPLLSMYTYKNGLDSFRDDVYTGILQNCKPRVISKCFLQLGTEHYFFVADLHLGWIGSVIISHLHYAHKKGIVHVICFEWQITFWQGFFQEHFPNGEFRYS